MPILLIAPVAAPIMVLALAIVFTRLWANDTESRAIRDLHILGFRPGRTYKVGGAWALHAARERGNLLLALLAVAAWIAVVISLDLSRR